MSGISRKQDKMSVFQSVKKSDEGIVASVTPNANKHWQMLQDLGLNKMSVLARYASYRLFLTRSNREKIDVTAKKLDTFSHFGLMASNIEKKQKNGDNNGVFKNS